MNDWIFTCVGFFVGEGGIDQGGPKQEFFRILSNEAVDRYLIGSNDHKFFISDISSLMVSPMHVFIY